MSRWKGRASSTAGKQLRNIAKRFKITHPDFFDKLVNAMRSQRKGVRHNLSEAEKDLRKQKHQLKAAEKEAQKAAEKEAKEAEARAKAAELQQELAAGQAGQEAAEPAARKVAELAAPALNGSFAEAETGNGKLD